TMLDLARGRLARFGDKVELLQGDFLATSLTGPFDVVLALGYFDYIEDAPGHLGRMRELCSGSAVASFPRWTWTKGPIRKLRYEVINNCPIYDYTAERLRTLFADAGLAAGLARREVGLPRARDYELSARNGRYSVRS